MATQAKGAPRGRKRALSVAPPPDSCVVIYLSQDRAFQRVFQETDIDEMKAVVKEKLGLGPSANIRLSQLAEGRRLDLEDDADFYAFQRSAQMRSEIQVEFSVIAPPPAQLASPSITSTSTNLEQAPPVQEGVGDPTAAPEPEASAPTKKKKKKKAAKNTQAPTSYAVVYDTLVSAKDDHKGKGKATELNEDAPATSTFAPPTSKAKAISVLDEPAAILPTGATNAEVSTKKPKSKAASKPPQPEEKTATTSTPSQPEVVVPTKAKKNKKAAATTTTSAPEASTATASTVPPATNTTTLTSNETAATADPEPTQPRSKKRGRKGGAEPTPTTAPEAPIQTTEPEPGAGAAEQPPAKKRRKSKAPADETDGLVATSLPPPGPSRRRSSVALNIDRSTAAPLSSVGSVADIVQRWASRTAEAEQRSRASGSEAAPNGVSSPTLPTQELGTDAVDQTVDATDKSKKRKKKAKEQPGDTSVQAPVLEKEVEDRNAFAPTVDPSITKAKEKRKDFAFEPPAIDAQSTPAPIRPTFPKPKKSKLSSVAVSHQSEGSSTDDEDILNSVMRTAPDSDAESVEEDDGKSDEEMAETLMATTPPAPGREATPPSPASASVTPQAAPVPLPPSSVPTNGLLQIQRMTQSNVRALLDDLEDEEAGNANKSDSDEEGSSLARSTPSDVVRRRHRKSSQMDAGDSDAGSYVEVVEDSQGEDVEMQDVAVRNDQEEEEEDEEGEEDEEEEERAPMTLSQMLKSSQSLDADIIPDNGGEDDIEDYESDAGVSKRKSPSGPTSSPIESPSGLNDQSSGHNEQPELDESNKSAQLDTTLPQPTKEAESAESDAEEPAEPEAPPPKRRGRPPLSQAVKDERAAEKARIQAEKAALKEGQGPKRGRPSLKSNKSTEVNPEEIENKAPEAEPEEATEGSRMTRKRSLSRVSSSQQKPALSQVPTSADAEPPAPKPRGRPRLSEAVLAERQAEKERVRAEKAIQRLEKKTAKANAKAAKGKGANTSAVEEPESAQDTNGDGSPGPASQRVVEKVELRSEASLPAWSVLKDPSSSRPESSQADELDWTGSDGEARVGNSSKGPLASQRSAKRDSLSSPDITARKADVTAKPLFLPSSGIAIKTASRFPPSSPLEATPMSRMAPLSQQTPLQRRKSVSSAMLPRFTDIQRNHSLRQQSRKEQNRLQSSSQPIKFNPPRDPKPNGASQDVVMVDDSSSSDGNSSGDEGKRKPLSQSQKKRRSAFDYFSQQ